MTGNSVLLLSIIFVLSCAVWWRELYQLFQWDGPEPLPPWQPREPIVSDIFNRAAPANCNGVELCPHCDCWAWEASRGDPVIARQLLADDRAARGF